MAAGEIKEMNLQIIIQLPEKLKRILDDIANDLYDDFKGNYASKENFWITIRELNNVDSFTLKQVKSALYNIASKSDPFTLYCDELMLTDPRKKSSLVYSLRGLTSKLYNLHQNIENALYKREIERDSEISSPNIQIAQKISYKQLPYIRTPQVPIEVGAIELIEKKQKFIKVEYTKIEEFPLFGGKLYVSKIDGDKVTCENSFGKAIVLDSIEMPPDLKEKDVIIKAGAQYAVDKNETRVRSIQEQIKAEKTKDAKEG